MKKTKILCTIGPACKDVRTLKQMYKLGMDAIRINTAHGSIPEYDKMIENVRKVADIPIMLDIKGPEIRIQSQCDETLKRGQIIPVGFSKWDGRYFNRNFYREVKVGDIVFLADGLIKTRVVEKKKKKVKLKVLLGGFLRQNKGVNIPGKELRFATLTAWDREVIAYAKRRDVDYIALSFTRTASDVQTLKRKLSGTDIGVIAKIESKESLNNLPEIIKTSDGIMVARGDLGIEIPSEKLPMLQKQLIGYCNVGCKIVIVATEMLKSMIWNPRPTRAETSDVANAILDGADGVMLSDETAIGRFPVRAVREMSAIAREVEPHVRHRIPAYESLSIDDSIANAVHEICDRVPVSKIVTLTRSGYTACLISRFRLGKEIIAITGSQKVKKKLNLAYGVFPIVHKSLKSLDIPHSAKYLLKRGLVNVNDLILVTAGMYSKKQHKTNVLHIHKISELIDFAKK